MAEETVQTAPAQTATTSTQGTPAPSQPTSSQPEITKENYNQFTSEQIKAFLDSKDKQPEAKPEEKVEAKPEATPEVKPEATPTGEAPNYPLAPKAEDKPKADAPAIQGLPEDKIAELVEKKVAERLATEKPKDEKKGFYAWASQEEYQKEYEADPTAATDKLLKAVVDERANEIIEAKLGEKLAPILERDSRVQQERNGQLINTHIIEAETASAEFKDKGSMLRVETEKFMADKQNLPLIASWLENKKNPFIEAQKLVRANNFDAYVKLAKEAGIKEGEERSKKAQQTFVEGAGKIQSDEPMTIDKFKSMSSKEMQEYLLKHQK